MIDLILPRGDEPQLQIEECLNFLDKIENSADINNRIEINMRNLKWILPCSALIVSHKLNELYNRGYAISFIEPEEKSIRDYLSTVGFPLGGGDSKKTLLPINHFINDGSSTKVIEREMKEVFEIVRINFPKELWTPIFYLLSELTDNMDQHSKFTVGSIMVQYYKNKGFIDIGILDNGLTIPGVYEKNKIEFSTDIEAIMKSTKGISTKFNEGGRGKGLETSKKLVNDGLEGEFYIISRKGMLISKQNNEDVMKKTNFALGGTLVYSRFNIPKKNLNIYEYVE